MYVPVAKMKALKRNELLCSSRVPEVIDTTVLRVVAKVSGSAQPVILTFSLGMVLKYASQCLLESIISIIST